MSPITGQQPGANSETESRGGLVRSFVFFGVALAVVVWSTVIFRGMHEPEPIVAGPGVTSEMMLSEIVPALAGTPADTPVFILEGDEPGGTFVVLGGVHAQEISGLLAAVLVIENVEVTKGRLVVVPQANRSGFTYTEPLDGYPHTFEIDTPHGPRWFRNGMRLTNPIHQWPDPELHIHYPTGEKMVGLESRNLNRNFPGNPNGTYTERLGHALIQLSEKFDADMLLDMHEAYPEYPIINMLVAHENAYEVAIMATLYMQMRGVPMDVMPSPTGLRGLSHREFGDYLDMYSMLSETANPAMGRFRGRTDVDLLVGGQDDNYVRAAELNRLFVPFTGEGHPLQERVARQLLTIEEMLNSYNESDPDRQIIIENMPTYEEVMELGIGSFLLAVDGQ